VQSESARSRVVNKTSWTECIYIMFDRLFLCEEMSRKKQKPKRRLKIAIVAVILVAALATAVTLTHYLSSPTDVNYQKKIFPGQIYNAWDGNQAPAGYVFRYISFALYVNGSVALSSGTNQSSWTCPYYVYGQEGNPGWKIDYAVVETESVRTS